MQQIESAHPWGTVGYVTANNPRYHLFYDALERLKVPNGTVLKRATNYNAAFSRNELIDKMEGNWICFLDDDHAFEPDALMRLLDRNIGIVGALYARRYPPHETVAYKRVNVDDNTGELFTWQDFDSMSGLIEVAAVGSGMFLVRREVLEAMPKAPFRITMPKINQWIDEAVWFCHLAQRAGFKVHMDLDVSLAHLTETLVIPKRWSDGKWGVKNMVSNRQWHN